MTPADVVAGSVRFDASRGDYGHLYSGLDRGGVRHHALGDVGNIGFGVQGAAVGVVVGRDRDRVRPGGLRQPGRLPGVDRGDALGLAVLPRVQLHPHRVVGPYAFAHGGEDVRQQPGAIVQAAAVVVVALVESGGEKLGDDVTVAAVDLHPVQPGAAGAVRGGGKCRHQGVDVRLRHHVQLRGRRIRIVEGPHLALQHALAEVAVGGGRVGGYPQGPSGLDILHTHQAAVVQLGGDFGTVRVHRIGDSAQAGDVAIVGDGDLARLVGAIGPHNAGDPEHDQADPAAGLALVVGHQALAAVAVALRQVDPHGGHHHAVLERHRTDAPGLRQVGEVSRHDRFAPPR